MPDTNEIIERERQFLLQTYHRYPLVLQRGKGVFLYDLDGKRYLDFVAGLGVNALGHAHPRIVKVIREQAARVIHLSNLYYNEFQGLLAEKLCRLSGLQRAFFSNSGTEAIEGSIKLARLAGHRAGGEAKSQLVGLEGSYHGRTFGAMSLTGQDKYRKGFDPMWFGPHRNHLRFSVIWRDTGHRSDSQADCRGPTAGGIPGKRGIRVGDFRRAAWDYFWWRPAGLPRGSRISGSPGRREAAGECSPRRAIFAGTVDVTWRALRGGAGSPGTRLHSRA